MRKKDHEARVKKHLDEIEEKNNAKAERVEERMRVESDVLKKSRDLQRDMILRRSQIKKAMEQIKFN